MACFVRWTRQIMWVSELDIPYLYLRGALDTFSRKILYLFVSHFNSDPMIVGKKYLEYLKEHRTLPRFL